VIKNGEFCIGYKICKKSIGKKWVVYGGGWGEKLNCIGGRIYILFVWVCSQNYFFRKEI